MSRAAVELRVAGQSYRVVTSAAEQELERLARVVEDKLREISGPGRPTTPQTLLLAALSLAHELEQERERREKVEQRAKEMLTQLLTRIDAALDAPPTPPAPDVEPHANV